MDLLQQSAQAWKEITEYRYLFTYGYKKQLYPINLTFSLEDYPHLAGFQYMKDISLPNYSSAKIADRILEGKILFEKVQKATQYEKMIKPRLEALVHLKESLDNKFNLYSYMPRMYPFITGIKADYLISSHFSVDNFIFIIKANAQGELKCDFLCCSIFEKGDRDYETNQKARTLMKKERIHIPSNTTIRYFTIVPLPLGGGFFLLSPLFNFATAHARPTRRSMVSRSTEILIPPTGHASDPHASHGSVNDTTYTTQSDFSGHVCRLHSKEACGESPPLEPELLDCSTFHRTDALQHTYHESFSMHDHIFSSHFYLFRISHNHYSLFSHALHSTALSLTQDSLDKHTVSSAY